MKDWNLISLYSEKMNEYRFLCPICTILCVLRDTRSARVRVYFAYYYLFIGKEHRLLIFCYILFCFVLAAFFSLLLVSEDLELQCGISLY